MHVVRANMSENPSLQLSKNEMVSQMAALTIAGHETTANTITWLLWELAKNPHYQERLREEIKEKRKEVYDRGGEGVDFTLENLESMPFLQAVLKVGSLSRIYLPLSIDLLTLLCNHRKFSGSILSFIRLLVWLGRMTLFLSPSLSQRRPGKSSMRFQ